MISRFPFYSVSFGALFLVVSNVFRMPRASILVGQDLVARDSLFRFFTTVLVHLVRCTVVVFSDYLVSGALITTHYPPPEVYLQISGGFWFRALFVLFVRSKRIRSS